MGAAGKLDPTRIRINDLAEGNPKQAAAVLRSWMAQG